MPNFQNAPAYEKYSNDIWDYLKDMPYMPSRLDRDGLLQIEDKRRVKIWDYFFRIKTEDVGIPQQKEIKTIKETIDTDIQKYENEVRDINSLINDLKGEMTKEQLKKAVYAFISILGAVVLAYYFLEKINVNFTVTFVCAAPFFLYTIIMLARIAVLEVAERAQIKDFKNRIQRLSTINKEKVDVARKRIQVLEVHITELQKQIPLPPSDDEVRSWLQKDFVGLWEKAKDSTGLGKRLLDIRGMPNPITILGPGELQRPSRIPPQYTANLNPDLNKHLTARQAFLYDTPLSKFSSEEFGVYVLYGVYYIEYILIADDMLATNGFFYDFINGRKSSEQTTEQYYKDVVAIATAKEFRRISIGVGGQEIIYIDDAPTFVLSLADGEKRTVTFVNEKYFKEIKQKIDISEESISRIYWIQESQEIADNAIKALRFRLRKHKGAPEENADFAA